LDLNPDLGTPYVTGRPKKKKGKKKKKRNPDIFPLTSSIFPLTSSIFFFFFLLGLHPRHMEIPWLGVELELQLLVNTTATALGGPSHVFDLYYSSLQHWILNTLSKARV